MYKKKIIVVAGLNTSEIKSFIDAVDSQDFPLDVVPLTEEQRSHKVGAIVESALGSPSTFDLDTLDGESLQTDCPMVFFGVYPRPEIDGTIDAFKSVVNRRAVYASLTPTNMVWLWKDLLEHLGEEHQFFLDREQQKRN